MQGQIERRGERTFRVRWFKGRDASGRREYGSRTVHGTKRDADGVLREILRHQEQGVLVESTGMRVDAFLDRWLVEAAPKKRRAATVENYREILKRYVRPTLGSKRLDRLSVLDVQAMVGQLEREAPLPHQPPRGRQRAKPRAPLSPQTIRYAHAVLSAAFGQAVRWRLIQANPARDVELPKRRTQRVMRALTPEECGRLRAALAGDRLEPRFVLLLGTGMRPGEALALRWPDADPRPGRSESSAASADVGRASLGGSRTPRRRRAGAPCRSRRPWPAHSVPTARRRRKSDSVPGRPTSTSTWYSLLRSASRSTNATSSIGRSSRRLVGQGYR